jgi:DNA-binding response OmpR family regulator
MSEDKKINILVVEDELPLMEAIETKLRLNNFEVVTARTAEQAFDYLENMEIKVLWLDHYLLGKENGLDIVSKIKNNDKYKNIPIFVVSNTASSDKVQSYINFGVSKYYVKSDVRLDKIIEDIKEYLEKPE